MPPSSRDMPSEKLWLSCSSTGPKDTVEFSLRIDEVFAWQKESSRSAVPCCDVAIRLPLALCRC